MERMFRHLRPDEIECRVGTVKKDGSGFSLLLYKDARCDMRILDETVGPMNWQKSYSRDNANCTVSIWDEKKGQWISKEDTGTESKTEAEKGLASDAFKRACFNWGLGRELYTAPFIWIRGNNTNAKYTVSDIGYDANGSIDRLVIKDSKGTVAYQMGKVKATKKPIPEEPQRDVAPGETTKPNDPVSITKALCDMAEEYGISTDFLLAMCKKEHLGDVSQRQYEALCAKKDGLKAAYQQWMQRAS